MQCIRRHRRRSGRQRVVALQYNSPAYYAELGNSGRQERNKEQRVLAQTRRFTALPPCGLNTYAPPFLTPSVNSIASSTAQIEKTMILFLGLGDGAIHPHGLPRKSYGHGPVPPCYTD